MDVIHGTNSPLLRVSDKERDKRLESLKYNMLKAHDIAQGSIIFAGASYYEYTVISL